MGLHALLPLQAVISSVLNLHRLVVIPLNNNNNEDNKNPTNKKQNQTDRNLNREILELNDITSQMDRQSIHPNTKVCAFFLAAH